MVADGQCATPEGSDLVGDQLAVGDLAAGDDDIGAVTGKGKNHLAAEAPTAARDDRNLAPEVEQ